MAEQLSVTDFRVRPTTIQRQTVEKLREAIISGIFKPGDRLIESELCALLGVSRPSVREALRSLEAQHLVTFEPNRGTQIPVITWSQAHDIYRVRAILEGEAAALCAEARTPEDLAAIKQAVASYADATHDADRGKLYSAAAKFYEAMLKGCGNGILTEIISNLSARVSLLRTKSMLRPGRAQCALQEFTEIYTAIEKSDPVAARRAAVTHVEEACKAARHSYKDYGELEDDI